MLLQVISDNTDSLLRTNTNSSNAILMFVVVGTILMLLLYFLLKPKYSKKVEVKNSNANSGNIVEAKYTKTKEAPEIKKETDKKKPQEVSQSEKKYIGYNPVNVLRNQNPVVFHMYQCLILEVL